jgi:hypothetical protein
MVLLHQNNAHQIRISRSVQIPQQKEITMTLTAEDPDELIRRDPWMYAPDPPPRPEQYSYPAAYRPLPLKEQNELLNQAFPGIGSVDAGLIASLTPQSLPRRPEHLKCEFWAAIPRWQLLGHTYGKALERVLQMLATKFPGGLKNSLEGRLGAKYLRQTRRTIEAMERLSASQKSDVVAVPTQFGLRVSRNAFWTMKSLPETGFGFDAFMVAILLLLHPERMGVGNYGRGTILCPECPGSEFNPKGKGSCFDDITYFEFDPAQRRIEFGGASTVGPWNPRYRSVTGLDSW